MWSTPNLPVTERVKTELVAKYRYTASKPADWLDENFANGLIVYTMPDRWRRRLRVSNQIGQAANQMTKRWTVKVKVHTREELLLCMVTTIVVEISEKWTSGPKT